MKKRISNISGKKLLPARFNNKVTRTSDLPGQNTDLSGGAGICGITGHQGRGLGNYATKK